MKEDKLRIFIDGAQTYFSQIDKEEIIVGTPFLVENNMPAAHDYTGIIGISGIDFDGTLLDFDFREVKVAQTIIANARTVFLATDHSKFGRRAMVKLGHVSMLDAVFVDHAPPQPMADLLEREQVSVHVAFPGRG